MFVSSLCGGRSILLSYAVALPLYSVLQVTGVVMNGILFKFYSRSTLLWLYLCGYPTYGKDSIPTAGLKCCCLSKWKKLFGQHWDLNPESTD